MTFPRPLSSGCYYNARVCRLFFKVHFTFQRIAKNYEKWLLFLRNCGFYYKGQVLYEKKKNQKNDYETTTLPGYHSYTSYTNFTRTPDSANLG